MAWLKLLLLVFLFLADIWFMALGLISLALTSYNDRTRDVAWPGYVAWEVLGIVGFVLLAAYARRWWSASRE